MATQTSLISIGEIDSRGLVLAMRGRVRVAAAPALFAAVLLTGTPLAHAWGALTPSFCASFSPVPPPPANFNICEYAIKELTIPAFFSSEAQCGPYSDGERAEFLLGNPFTAPPVIPRPHCVVLEQATRVWPISEACRLAPECQKDRWIQTLDEYVWYHDEVTCEVDPAVTAEDLLLRIFHGEVKNLTDLAFGGLNSHLYITLEDHLDAIECAFGRPLPEALKDVMIALRDDVGFEGEEAFTRADLDNIRIISEDVLPILSDSKWGITLGHLIVLRDDESPTFPIVRDWNFDWAQVQAGQLCPNERYALMGIMHEAVHARQYRNIGKEQFVNQYLVEYIVDGLDYEASSFEQEAYAFSGTIDRDTATWAVRPGPVTDRILFFLTHAAPGIPAGCTPVTPMGTPPPVSMMPGATGGPVVTIVSMCGATACAPDTVECEGAHSANVTLVGAAVDPDGVVARNWFTDNGSGTQLPLGTGDMITVPFASNFPGSSGHYLINFAAQDPGGHFTVAPGVLEVRDRTPPTITMNPAAAEYECGVASYSEPGASASDLCDPNPPVQATFGVVNNAVPGQYTITYTATDDAGNTAMAERIVTIKDTRNPTIDAPPSIVTQDRTPALGTATATDLCTTPEILNDAPAIFPYGTTVVTWWSRDAAGNESVRDTQLVTVLGADASATGHDLSCGLSREGQVYCWGANDAGQVGDGANVDRWAPLPVNMSGTVRQLSVGPRHVCVVKDDRTVQCWGSGADGRLGNGSTANRNLPVTVSGLSDVLQVSAGGGQAGLLFADDGHTCAVLESGAVRCWGENAKGQLGNASTTDSSVPVVTQMPAGVVAIQVTAGGEHSCAIDTLGRAYCWGEGADGRLGTGGTTDRNRPTLVNFPTGVRPFQIDAGERHTCAVDQLGSVWCWGDNANGRLGIGSYTDQLAPARVNLPASAVQVSAGLAHTCAVLVDGRAYCWGTPLHGRLGDGVVLLDQLVPIQVAGVTNAVQISTGKDHTCARLYDGSALRDVCWGDNNNGELGDGTWFLRETARQVSTLCESTGSFPIATGSFSSCTVGVGAAAPSNVMCWGSNDYGQLGDGTGEQHFAPLNTPSTAGASVAAAGGNHACALEPGGRIRCWGDNFDGQIGDGTYTQRFEPTLIADLTSYAFVATGAWHSCGITTAGQVKCWGANYNGQLGDNTNLGHNAPAPVALPGAALYLDLGQDHSCAVVQNGADTEVWCWGANLHGQLGNNSFLDSWIPVCSGSINNAWTVAAGTAHTCASTKTGPVYCWGHNQAGQLGNGSTADSWVPVFVRDTSGVLLHAPFASIGAGRGHSCAAPVGPTQRAACWGRNSSGQLGNGTTTASTRAQFVSNIAFVSHVSVGGDHTCARPGGTGTMCWGENSSGQLGDGTSLDRSIPVQVAGACY